MQAPYILSAIISVPQIFIQIENIDHYDTFVDSTDYEDDYSVVPGVVC